VHAQEDLLREVLGGLGAAQPGEGDQVDEPEVPLDERVELAGVALADGLDEIGIGRRGQGVSGSSGEGEVAPLPSSLTQRGAD
jgi:hypothetical protein